MRRTRQCEAQPDESTKSKEGGGRFFDQWKSSDHCSQAVAWQHQIISCVPPGWLAERKKRRRQREQRKMDRRNFSYGTRSPGDAEQLSPSLKVRKKCAIDNFVLGFHDASLEGLSFRIFLIKKKVILHRTTTVNRHSSCSRGIYTADTINQCQWTIGFRNKWTHMYTQADPYKSA